MSDSGMDKRGASGWDVTFTPTADASNACVVTIQVVDNDNNNIDEPVVLDVWISSAATGIGLATAADTLNVDASGSGTDLGILTAAQALRVLTSATGRYDLEITDTDKLASYVACTVPFQGGRIAVSDVLTTADYT